MKLHWMAVALASCFALACGDGDENEPQAGGGDGCDGDVPSFTELTAFSQVCVNCHDSDLEGMERNGAPEGYDFDVYESARDEAEEIEELVRSGEMPPAYAGFTLSDAQKNAIYLWAGCGTPR